MVVKGLLRKHIFKFLIRIIYIKRKKQNPFLSVYLEVFTSVCKDHFSQEVIKVNFKFISNIRKNVIRKLTLWHAIMHFFFSKLSKIHRVIKTYKVFLTFFVLFQCYFTLMKETYLFRKRIKIWSVSRRRGFESRYVPIFIRFLKKSTYKILILFPYFSSYNYKKIYLDIFNAITKLE